MNVTEMRAYVRLFLDTDEDELSNTLLDVFRTEAEARVQRAPWMLRWFQTSWTITTVANTQSYAYSTFEGVVTVDELATIDGERWQLRYVAHDEAARRFAGWSGTTEPIEWSVYADAVYLWPTPNDAYTLAVRGAREPVAATLGADTPDLPSAFHPLVAEYMLARAYEQQDQPDVAAQKFAKVEQEIEVLRARNTRAPHGGVLVLGAKREPDDFLLRNGVRYDWQ